MEGRERCVGGEGGRGVRDVVVGKGDGGREGRGVVGKGEGRERCGGEGGGEGEVWWQVGDGRANKGRLFG